MVLRDSTSTMTSLTFNNYYPGWQVPLIASASGQAYFSYASAEEQEDLLCQSRARAESHDALLLADFESGVAQARIRAQGYAAVARTAYSANPGRTSSFAIPLMCGDTLLGSLAMVYFANAMTPAQAIERFLGPLREVAEKIGDGMALPVMEARA
jgi:IclR family mhp operon transcriptional activator